MTTEEQAYELLKDSAWFEEISEALLRRLASVMTPVQAKEGQIFVQEGKPIEDIIILEKGSLLRTKLALDQPEHVKASQHEVRHLRHDSRVEYILDKSIVVDKLQGKGRISGLLHSIRPGSLAFASVTATNDDCKLWIIKSTEFRAILAESPAYALDVMAAMAKELRSGSKSLRGLMEAVQKSDRPESVDSNVPSVKVLCYDSTTWTVDGFKTAVKAFNQAHKDELYIDMQFTTERLSEQTATFAAGYNAVCLFVNDNASAEVLKVLSRMGVKMIAMRCAGFDRVDTRAAKAFDFTVCRVPAYSPYAVAEMAVALLMSVNRKIHHASNRVKMGKYSSGAPK